MVNPGDVIAMVVPVGADHIAEVRVRPQDVAQIRPGQETEITVTAFDPNVFGTVTDKVDVVSPSTFEDEQGTPYYKATVTIASQTLQTGNNAPRLLPGMVVEASIVTGSKSIMCYLLKPVYRCLIAPLPRNSAPPSSSSRLKTVRTVTAR